MSALEFDVYSWSEEERTKVVGKDSGSVNTKYMEVWKNL